MANLRILVPDATTNYVKNPSIRYDTTGYTAVGSAISRSGDRARFGFYSMKIITNGSANGEGVYYRLTWLTGIQTALTASVYLRGSGKVRLRLIDNNSGGNYASKSVNLTDTRWTRLDVTGRCSGGNDVRVIIETSDSSPKALTIYSDGFQLEPHEYVTTYCDGDQPGCSWTVLQHGSISTRSGSTREGGRFVQLVGCDRPEQNLYVTVLGGMGVASIRNNIQDYSDAPGAFHQNIKVLSRSITMLFHAKSPDLPGNKEKSLRDLHSLRQLLFSIIQPDKTPGNQEFTLEYQDGDRPLYIGVRYESGLEGEWDVRNRWVQSFPIRFLVCNPFYSDDGQEIASLSIRDNSTVNYVAQRVDGNWSEMNGGLSASIRQFAIGARGEIVAVGDALKANNKTTAIDPQIPVNYVMYWDGIQWQKMGSGANGIIYSVSPAPNGDVYVTGNFTQIGGVVCNYAARWDYVTKTWNALGTGLNGIGYTVKVDPSSGKAYFGGAFTTAGGIVAYRFAMYDGSWHALGPYRGVNNNVYSIDCSPDGLQVYLSGAFTDEFGNPGSALNCVAVYESYYGVISALGDGFDNTVLRIIRAPSGRVYACGYMTLSGTTPILRIGYWNGMTWYDLDIGANGPVFDMDVASDGTVIAVGLFTRIGSVDVSGIGLFTGTAWVPMDVYPSAYGTAVIRDQKGNVYFSFNGTSAQYAKSVIVNNNGTAEVPASFYAVGPGNLIWLENQTAKKRLYLDLDILNGEEIVIDSATGKVTSSQRGDLSFSILPSSDFRSWKLLPGDNKISCFMMNDVSASVRVYYSPRFWSADSTVRAESI